MTTDATAGARRERRDAEIDHLAYVVRSAKDGPEARSARLGDNRVDFIRGKDFYRWIIDVRRDLLDEHAPVNDKKERETMENDPVYATRANEARARHVGQALLQRGYLIRCEREIKHARKGRVKLVKFPHYL